MYSTNKKKDSCGRTNIRRNIHMVECTQAVVYTRSRVSTVEKYTRWDHGGDGGTTEGTYTRRRYSHDGKNIRKICIKSLSES